MSNPVQTFSVYEYFGDRRRLFKSGQRPDTVIRLARSVFNNGYAGKVAVVNEETGVTRDTIECPVCITRNLFLLDGECPECGRETPVDNDITDIPWFNF